MALKYEYKRVVTECVYTREVSGVGVGSRGFIRDRGGGVDVGSRRQARVGGRGSIGDKGAVWVSEKWVV